MQLSCCSSYKKWNVWIQCSHIICTTLICFFTTSDRNWLCLRLGALFFRNHYNQVLLLVLEKCYLAANMAPEAAPQWSSQFLKNDKWSHRPLRSMHGGALHQQSKSVSGGPVELKGFVYCFKKMTCPAVNSSYLALLPFSIISSLLLQEHRVHQWSGPLRGSECLSCWVWATFGVTLRLYLTNFGSLLLWRIYVRMDAGGCFGVTLKDLKQRETNGGRSESKRGQACVSGGLKRRVGADKLISGQSL